MFNPNSMEIYSDKNKIINPNETKKHNNNSKYSNRVMEKVNFLEMTDFIRGSVYLLCSFFRPTNFFPESREEFCMDYDALTKTIYLYSGNSSNINTHQLWKYNLLSNTWANIETNFTPEPRRGHTGILYKNKYYIFGGKYINSNILAKLDIFDLSTNSWSTNNYNYFLFKIRRNHIACLIGSQMLIHGGVDENDEILDDSYLLNLTNNLIWSKTSIMPILIPPKLAYHSCCLVITSDILYNNKFNIYRIPNSFIAKKLNSRIKEMGMYVFGGKNKTICNDMWLLKVGKKPLEWEKVLTFGQPPCPRYLCSMNFFEKGNFIVVHGGKTKINTESFALKDTYLFELYRYQWLRVDYGDKEYIVKKRCSHSSVVCDDKLFIFGGINDGVFNGSKFFVINLDVSKAKMNLIKSGKTLK
jgi:N-acetylneuraminic acid mutarotase